jgi:hypothetical protein
MDKYEAIPPNADLPYSDCGVFVATVMKMSGVDPNYYSRGTNDQYAYIQKHPEKYKIIHDPQSTADLPPGQAVIMITEPGVAVGHTYIYTGDYKGSDGRTYNSAAASLGGHVPEADGFYQGGSENQTFDGVVVLN